MENQNKSQMGDVPTVVDKVIAEIGNFVKSVEAEKDGFQ